MSIPYKQGIGNVLYCYGSIQFEEIFMNRVGLV